MIFLPMVHQRNLQVRPDKLRILPQHKFVTFQRQSPVARFLRQHPELKMCGAIFRFQVQHLPEFFSRRHILPHFHQQFAQIQQRIQISGIGSQFFNEMIAGLRQPPLGPEHIGNPGMHLPTLLGALPGMSAFATSMMKKEMEKIDIPPVGEFITMIHDAGCEMYACRATVDMFHLKPDDFCPEVDGVISVGQFYEKAAGAQIIFT